MSEVAFEHMNAENTGILKQTENTADKMWKYFMARINNPYGVAALMGCINDISNMNTKYYSAKSDSSFNWDLYNYHIPIGSVAFKMEEFVHDNVAYGLCGWKWWARKQGLYNLARVYRCNVDDSIVQTAFIWDELQAPSNEDILKGLKKARYIKEAVDLLSDRYFADRVTRICPMENRTWRVEHGQMYYDWYVSGLSEETEKKKCNGTCKECKCNEEKKNKGEAKFIEILADATPVKKHGHALAKNVGRVNAYERFQYIASSKNKRWHCIYYLGELRWVPAKRSKVISS